MRDSILFSFSNIASKALLIFNGVIGIDLSIQYTAFLIFLKSSQSCHALNLSSRHLR